MLKGPHSQINRFSGADNEQKKTPRRLETKEKNRRKGGPKLFARGWAKIAYEEGKKKKTE